MCGGSGAAERAAQQAAGDEKARQQRIRQGTQQLDAIFGGGDYSTGQVAKGTAFDPNATYYDVHGNAVTGQSFLDKARTAAGQGALLPGGAGQDMGYSDTSQIVPGYPGAQGGQPSADAINAQALSDFNSAIDSGLYTGTKTSTGFEPAYQKAYQAQLDYALPEVDRQFQDAQRQLQYSLARQSMGASSVASGLTSKLAGDRELQIQKARDQAQGVRDTMESNANTEHDNLVKMLQQSGDVDSVANAAQSRAALLQSSPGLQTLQPLFQNATAGLADMFVSPAIRTAAGTAPVSGYASSKGSGRVVA